MAAERIVFIMLHWDGFFSKPTWTAATEMQLHCMVSAMKVGSGAQDRLEDARERRERERPEQWEQWEWERQETPGTLRTPGTTQLSFTWWGGLGDCVNLDIGSSPRKCEAADTTGARGHGENLARETCAVSAGSHIQDCGTSVVQTRALGPQSGKGRDVPRHKCRLAGAGFVDDLADHGVAEEEYMQTFTTQMHKRSRGRPPDGSS